MPAARQSFIIAVAVWILKGLIEAALNDLLCHLQLVGGGADVADHPLCFGLQQTFVHASPVTGLIALLHVVQLVDIDIVCLQKPQGGLQVLPEGFRGLGMGLGRDDELFSFDKARAKGLSQLLLTVAVGPCGVKKAHASAVGFAQEPDCLLLGNALDRKGAETVLGNYDAGFP